MLSLANFTPDELCLPSKFTAFRDEQIEAIEYAANSTARFDGLCLPTGAGKTIVGVGLAKATGLRTAILTSTKGLQTQYETEFRESGLVDIRGKANYPCADQRNLSCRFGPLEGCRLTNGRGCTYECARDEARASQIIVTNYAYWIRINERSRGLEPTIDIDDPEESPAPIELLILDEAHKASEELSRNIQVVIREPWLREARLPQIRTDEFREWVDYASEHAESVDIELSAAKASLKQKPSKLNRDRVYALDSLAESLSQIMRMNKECWVLEMKSGTNWGRVWEWDCVWPGQFAESRLFLGIPKIVLMSATLRPVAMSMLGIKKSDSISTFREWPRVFPAHHTPIYNFSTIRMNHRITDEQQKEWLNGIDSIIESRIDRKGIIHTGSYARQQYLLAHSRFQQHFIVNSAAVDSETAGEIVERFKASSAPSILVSPSFSTGWDFPGRFCEWQIIGKLSFPDTRSKVMKARKERSEQYISYLAMQDLVQACGRGTRFYEDRCEIFAVDASISWFMMQNKHLAPRWFDVRKVSQLPPPGKRCTE